MILASRPSKTGLPWAKRMPAASVDVYAELGVRPFINAAGTYTALSASLMPKEVREAMESAASRYVSIPELQEAAGRLAGVLVLALSLGHRAERAPDPLPQRLGFARRDGAGVQRVSQPETPGHREVGDDLGRSTVRRAPQRP